MEIRREPSLPLLLRYRLPPPLLLFQLALLLLVLPKLPLALLSVAHRCESESPMPIRRWLQQQTKSALPVHLEGHVGRVTDLPSRARFRNEIFFCPLETRGQILLRIAIIFIFFFLNSSFLFYTSLFIHLSTDIYTVEEERKKYMKK